MKREGTQPTKVPVEAEGRISARADYNDRACLGGPLATVPFASPMRLPDGKFGMVDGSIELRPDADTCPHCGTGLVAIVRDLTVGEPAGRATVLNQWKAAGERILKALLRERA